jgi:crotonobetainyl-CoA:carnitine CoA-transferase CaiB-like acyl-CoA transferase
VFPGRMSETTGDVSRPAPLPGEHSEEILGECGFEEHEIRELVRSGVVISIEQR